MKSPSVPESVFEAKPHKGDGIVTRVALGLLVLGFLSVWLGINLIKVILALAFLIVVVLVVGKFHRDNRSSIKQANRGSIFHSAWRSVRLIVVVFVVLLPGIGIHFLLEKTVDMGVNQLDYMLDKKIKITENVPNNHRIWELAYWKQKETQDIFIPEIKGIKAYTLATLREALLWLNRFFVVYLIYVAVWQWCRYTARIYIGQSGHIRFTLKDHA
jgi:hypothetical protein